MQASDNHRTCIAGVLEADETERSCTVQGQRRQQRAGLGMDEDTHRAPGGSDIRGRDLGGAREAGWGEAQGTEHRAAR